MVIRKRDAERGQRLRQATSVEAGPLGCGRRTGAWILKKRVVKYCLASKPRCLSNILHSGKACLAGVVRYVGEEGNAPAALELVVIEVHHAVAAARDRGQELALANLLV